MFREIAGEAVLLDLNSETYFGLDEIGTRMWSVLLASASIEDAYQVLLDEFDVEPEALRSDLSAFLEKLAGSGLVSLTDA
jgi:hypothetical protein